MYDLAVIGLGPGGLAAVDEALSNGLDVIAFEKNELGGTCLNLGCVPTKSILHCSDLFNEIKNCSKLGIELSSNPVYDWKKVINRKNETVLKFTKLLNNNLSKKIKLVKAEAQLSIVGNEVQILASDNIYMAKNIIIATGSKPYEIKGLEFNGKDILSSDDLFNLENLPKRVAIVGSGAVGLEWSKIFSDFNVDVKLIEKASALAPAFDVDIQKRVERILKLNKIEFFKNDFIADFSDNIVTLNSNKTFETDIVLISAGRTPVFPKINISGCSEEFKLKTIDDFETEINNLYVIGDASGGVMLAHNAAHQAKIILDKIIKKSKIEKKLIPSVVYLSPEIASIGLREQDIDDSYKIHKIPVSAIAKSWCDDRIEGFIKVIIKDDLIKGAHIISNEASALVSLFSVFMDSKITIDKIKKMVFPHPSYSEVILEVLKNE